MGSDIHYYSYADLDALDEESDQLAEIIRALETQLSENPDDIDLLNKLGRAYYLNYEDEKSEEIYRKTLALGSESARSYGGLGDALYELEQYEEAATNYRKAIEFQADDDALWTNLGVTYESWNKYHEAELTYKEAIRLNPEIPENHYKRDD